MNKKVSILMLLGLILLLLFAAFGSQALAKTGKRQATVPFKVTYQTFPVPRGVDGDGYLILEIPADGKGTHLGKSEWYADSLVSLGPNPNTQTGEMVFTAANGDQLIGSFEGWANLSDSGGAEYGGEYEISEGTGRFTGATGSGDYYGSAGPETGTLTFEGTLTNP